MFYSSLQFAILNSYPTINLKLSEAVYCGRDRVAMLPTKLMEINDFSSSSRLALLHDKTLQLRGQLPTLPQVCSVVAVVWPLNGLTEDQIRRVLQGTLKAAALIL